MTVLETFTTSLMDSSPAHWVQTLFILASCFILTITVAPAAERKLLLNYGARRSHDDTATGGRISFAKDETKDSPIQTVRKLTSFGQVPHSWFFTYYVFYIFCAEAWAVQYFLDGPNLLGFLANRQVTFAPDAPAMSGSQISIIWVMMFLQAGRRLCECFVVMKPSKSTMWFVHWVVGLGYYLGVSVAIWVEGSAAIVHNQLPGALSADVQLKAVISIPVFLCGWVMQHQCHKHLAGLKKYSLPDSGMFSYLVCPHYTCECLIYISLAVLGAPAGQWCNRTLLSVLTFVAVNLGATAYGTRNWYREKFGPERLEGKWIMIPFVY